MRQAAERRQRTPAHEIKETSRDIFAERVPDRVEKQLADNFAKADVEYRTRYERLHGLFERIFRDPERAIQRFNAIRERRGEERVLKLLERKPNRISPTKDALRAYFQHSTRERVSAFAARTNIREVFRAVQEADDHRIEAGDALRRYRIRLHRKRER